MSINITFNYIRKIFVKIASNTFKLGSFIGKVAKKIAPMVSRPFSFLFRKIGRYVFLPAYKLQLFIKRKLFGLYSPAKSRVFQFLTKRYVVHGLIIVLAVFVIAGNINAQEIREEDFGEETIIFSLFNEQPLYELVEETAVFQPQDKILSYLDKSSGVENRKLVQDESAQVTEEQLAEGLSAVTGGGSAVLKPNITETDIALAARSKNVEHTVEDGETISNIAERYGVSLNTVLWANNMTSKSIIKPGSTLVILPVTGIAHTVVKGETLGSISNKYDIEEEKIREFNRLPEEGTIVLGKELIVPGGEQPFVASAPRRYVSAPATGSNTLREVVSVPSSAPDKVVSAGGGMVWPTAWRVITQYYSWRHHGLDIDGDYTTPNYASDSGVVERSNWGGGYGNMVIINHGNGIKTLYAHFSKIYVKKGEYVTKGQALGMVGTTGFSTGTHLHFEVIVNGVKKNPLSYVR